MTTEISHPCTPSLEAGRGWLYPELVLRRMGLVQMTLLCNPSVLGHPGSPPGNLDLSTTAPSYHTTASPCMHGASGDAWNPACSDTDRTYSCLPQECQSVHKSPFQPHRVAFQLSLAFVTGLWLNLLPCLLHKLSFLFQVMLHLFYQFVLSLYLSLQRQLVVLLQCLK